MKNKTAQNPFFTLPLLALLILLLVTSVVYAQEENPPPANSEGTTDQEYATYVIQSGDTLASIAYQFGIALDDLITANNIDNPNTIAIGTELVLPGILGVEGTLTNLTTGLGDTLQTYSKQYEVSAFNLMYINKLVSPAEIYKGSTLIIPIKETLPAIVPLTNMNANTTLLEEAVLSGQGEWDIANANQKQHRWQYIPSELIFQYTQTTESVPAIAASVSEITISPEVINQGSMVTVTVSTTKDISLSGSLGPWELHFFEESPNTWVAYAGIHALTTPGLIPFTLSGQNEEIKQFSFEQFLVINDSYYGSESIFVDQATLDVGENEKEDELIFSVVAPATPTKYWSAPFTCVVDQPVCIRSWYGTNRSYNDGYYYSFHSGLDYGVCASLNIYAPMDGMVVFTDSLTVRGNLTIIDHGWGVYSSFYHQSEILVEVGQKVTKGQLIGLIGTTGRSTGAHLHYDLFVNGVQVSPLNLLDPLCQ